jgi:hypothetical protein
MFRRKQFIVNKYRENLDEKVWSASNKSEIRVSEIILPEIENLFKWNILARK